MSARPYINPSDQLQIGDEVTYLPEGVHTRISGYAWSMSVGSDPYIIAYRLDCGISVGRDLISRRPAFGSV